MSRILSVLALLILVGVGITFTVFNPHTVTLNYVVGNLNVPLALLMVIVLAAGVLLGLLFAGFKVVRLKREIHQLRRKARLAQEEVTNLRAIPIKDSH